MNTPEIEKLKDEGLKKLEEYFLALEEKQKEIERKRKEQFSRDEKENDHWSFHPQDLLQSSPLESVPLMILKISLRHVWVHAFRFHSSFSDNRFMIREWLEPGLFEHIVCG
jgi:hypothetical protein